MNRTRALLLAVAVPLVIVVGLLVSAAFSGGDDGSSRPASSAGSTAATASTPRRSRVYAPPGTRRSDVGEGPAGAAIFSPEDDDFSEAVVIFLHGWTAVDPAAYGAWIGHLVRGGATVIYPAYQQAPYLDTISPLASTLVALGLAFDEVEPAGRRVVVVGHSAGGALAADYAASARAAGLPSPAAVFSVYPGRSLRGIPLRIPVVDAENIPAGTRVLALAGARDRVVGTRVARVIARTATRARTALRIVRDRAVDTHGGPQDSGRAARRTFWAPLDRLIAATG
ncbi:MAG: alpha/beta hydrolase fold domain-containing protein [Solirubrobacteraceae bacterium]